MHFHTVTTTNGNTQPPALYPMHSDNKKSNIFRTHTLIGLLRLAKRSETLVNDTRCFNKTKTGSMQLFTGAG